MPKPVAVPIAVRSLRYIDHSSLKVQATKYAQDLLMANYNGCRSERNFEAMGRLWNAVNHLAESVKSDPDCWIGGQDA